MINIDTVLIKVASRCNINCQYCYIYNMGDTNWENMPGQMSRETLQATVQALCKLTHNQQRRFAVVLHGGEPLLLGPKNLDFLLSRLRSVLPIEYPLSIQTNGMLITERLLDVCSTYHTSLGVSIDGPKSLHDQYRVGHQGEGTFDKVLAGIGRLRKHKDAEQLFKGLLAVIDPASSPGEVYRFFKSLGAPSIDFLYRDGDHSKLPYGKASFQSTEYGRWLAGLLDIYLADPAPIRIRLLDDMIKLILGGQGTKEGVGNAEFGIVIIDTDGSIRKNDTLKSNFDGADHFAKQWSVHRHGISELTNTREFKKYHSLLRPTASACLSCPELYVCGGGMPVTRWHYSNGYNNPSVYCADQLLLIEHMRKRLTALMAA
ncbi:MAG: radical SAM protein [Gammaproteobacteria bacterium]|nr:radical SAM protein [Gammaproteobacteria bacterium]